MVDKIGNAETHQETEEDSTQKKAGVFPIHAWGAPGTSQIRRGATLARGLPQVKTTESVAGGDPVV
jgi:hypothetical protein